MGDFVDRRSSTPTRSVEIFKNFFFDKIAKRKINLTITIGNHDCYFMNTNSPNAMEFFKEYDNIDWIWDAPREKEFGNLNILFVPWIAKDNYDKSIAEIQYSNAPVCMGHLELQGFEMHRGVVSKNGMSGELFKSFQKVFSGHFHTQSSKGNIQYLGTPYQLTWADYGDARGFWIFDTDTLDMEFVENPKKIFHKFNVGEDASPIDLQDCFVRVYTNERDQKSDVDDYLEKMKLYFAKQIQVVENKKVSSQKEEYKPEDIESQLSFMQRYVNNSDLEEDRKTAVFSILKDAYNLV